MTTDETIQSIKQGGLRHELIADGHTYYITPKPSGRGFWIRKRGQRQAPRNLTDHEARYLIDKYERNKA